MANINNSVFTISLDAVDLNLLPTIYNERPDKVSPLWTRSNLQMRSDDYYQFEIKCKDCEGSNEDQLPKLEYKNKICHICDIEVPRPFWNDHGKSLRHKINVKIADIAIQRMKTYLNDADHEYDFEVHPSAHFCPTCVTVIDSKDRNVHEKSASHRNACIVEKFFNDFLALYNYNENNISEPNEQPSNINDVETEISHKLINNKENEVNNADRPIAKSIDKDTKTVNKDKLNLIEYINLINNRCNGISMFFKVLNDNLIEIEALDGSIVQIADKDFHGFNKIGKKHWQCLICKILFKEKKGEAHKLSETHLNKVCLPLKNKHCLRYINAECYHCVICNSITENADLHLLCNDNHEKLLKLALISDKLNETPTNYNIKEKSQIYQEVVIFENANDDQQSTNKNMSSYADKLRQTPEKSMPHDSNMNLTSKKAKDSTIINEDIDQNETVLFNDGKDIPEPQSKPLSEKSAATEKTDVVTDKYFCEASNVFTSKHRHWRHKLRPKHIFNLKSNSHYLLSEIDDEYLLCKVCDSVISNNIENIRKHVLDEGHKMKYDHLLLWNGLRKIDEDKFYCGLCEELVLSRNEIIHIAMRKHQLKCYTTELIGLSDNDGKNLRADDHEDEYNSNDSERENSGTEQENSEAEVTKTVLEFYQCAVCNVKVPNYSNHIQQHLKGRVHLRNMEKYSVDSNNTQDKVTNYHYHMEMSEFPNVLNCIICSKHILYNEVSVVQHLNDLQHLRNYEILLETNFLVNKTDNIYCDVCAVFVGLKGELLHIKGRKHKKNLEKHNQTPNKVAPVTVEIDKVEKINISNGDNYYPSEALINAAASKNIKLEMVMFLKEADHNDVECVVCKVNIPFNEHNVRTHINGNRHAQNLKSGSNNDE